MMIHEITSLVGKNKTRKRIGRGHGSGHGKTSGRGHKGAGQRAGHSHRAGFEGGQMPFARRIPKRGFTNVQFKKHFHIVNVRTLEAIFEDGATIDAQALAAKGIIRDTSLPLKVLGDGDLTKKLTVTAGKVTGGARAKIEAAGGSVTEQPKVKWMRDRSIKKSSKSPKAAAPEAAQVEADSSTTTESTEDAKA
jgi:large subunit ribosomal protein L15